MPTEPSTSSSEPEPEPEPPTGCQTTLPSELISLILDEHLNTFQPIPPIEGLSNPREDWWVLSRSRQRSFVSISLVCRQWRELARRVYFRGGVYLWSVRDTERKLHVLEDMMREAGGDEGGLPAIRQLTISFRHVGDDVNVSRLYQQYADFVQRFGSSVTRLNIEGEQSFPIFSGEEMQTTLSRMNRLRPLPEPGSVRLAAAAAVEDDDDDDDDEGHNAPSVRGSFWNFTRSLRTNLPNLISLTISNSWDLVYIHTLLQSWSPTIRNLSFEASGGPGSQLYGVDIRRPSPPSICDGADYRIEGFEFYSAGGGPPAEDLLQLLSGSGKSLRSVSITYADSASAHVEICQKVLSGILEVCSEADDRETGGGTVGLRELKMGDANRYKVDWSYENDPWFLRGEWWRHPCPRLESLHLVGIHPENILDLISGSDPSNPSSEPIYRYGYGTTTPKLRSLRIDSDFFQHGRQIKDLLSHPSTHELRRLVLRGWEEWGEDGSESGGTSYRESLGRLARGRKAFVEWLT